MSTPKLGFYPQKSLICVWWNIKSVINYEQLEYGRIITVDIYYQQIDSENEALLKRKGIILQ